MNSGLMTLSTTPRAASKWICGSSIWITWQPASAIGADIKTGHFLFPQVNREGIHILLAESGDDHGVQEGFGSQIFGVPARARQRTRDGGWQYLSLSRFQHYAFSPRYIITPVDVNTRLWMLSRIKTPQLTEIATLFLTLCTISFGGPAAHIALMEDEVVRRRRWLSHEEFMDLIGATNLIPGPNSTEMAIHIGLRRAGWAGFLVAGGCFVLPATVIVTFCAWLYVRYGSLPEAGAILYGVKPVMIAVVLQALWALGRAALKTKTLLMLAAAAAILNFLGVNELVIL